MAKTKGSLMLVEHKAGTEPARHVPLIRILEDEIWMLRRSMELTYMNEATLCSDLVIEISRKLDVKINEYMQVKRANIV